MVTQARGGDCNDLIIISTPLSSNVAQIVEASEYI